MKNKIFGLVLFFLFPQFSHAYLSEQTSGLLKLKRSTNYKSVAIDETADTDGVIRKIHWKGGHHPDLKNLLGPCYSYYQDYLKQNDQLRMRGAITIDRGGCHINIGGHMRSISGEASIDK